MAKAKKKYEFTGETKIIAGVKFHRIRALVAIAAIGVAAGDLGGWVESENNLSHVYGDAWVSGDAHVYGDAWVSGDAHVYGDAQVYGNAQVYGDARVSGDAHVYGNAHVYGDAQVYGNARDVPCYDDVRTLTADRLRADGLSPNIICGGFPCQNVSIASTVHGGNTGLDGAQSGLWSEYFQLIKEIRPEYAIIENVDRLAGDGLDRVLGSLASIRYDAQWDTLRGWLVGAPQERPRIWIVAYPAGKRVEGLFESVRAFAAGQRWPGGSAHLFDVAGSPFVGSDRIPQPLLRGMDDRPPDWVDRVHACGNAVIPQIPEIIGRAILAAHKSLGALP